MIIPAPEHGLLQGRGQIKDSDMVWLENSKTTRKEVLLRFGEPDLIVGRDRVLVYHWTVSHGYWFVGAYYSGAAGAFPKDYLLMLEFDDRGLLKRFEKSGRMWALVQDRLDSWAPQGTVKPLAAGREIFIIDPVPQAHAARSGKAVIPLRISVENISYRAAPSPSVNLIGHKIAAFGVIVADVRTWRPFTDMVRSAIAAHMASMGHLLVDRDADILITGDLGEFAVTTFLRNPLSWDAIGSLDITMKIYPSSTPHDVLIRRYQSTHALQTVLGPSQDDFEQVMVRCLEDMLAQMNSDAELAKIFRGSGR